MIPQNYFDKVKQYFNGDEKRTWSWFNEINPKFGMLSPMAMIKVGRKHKVIQLIDKEMSHAINQGF